MAKKKPEEPPKGSPAWMATFSDLMNLLLCFFVLLFSMSSIDASKYEQVVASLTQSFSIFSGGASAIGEGTLISSGVSQLNELDEYFSNAGKASEEDEVNEADPMKEYKEELKKEQKEKTEKLYEDVVAQTEKQNVADSVSVQMDTEAYQFVQISLSGAILFDSGQADIKESAFPVLARLGNILKRYKGYQIKIEGHTDSVPINSGSSRYKDNMELSQERALSVFRYLRDKKDLDPTMLESSGRGEYVPIASNKTEEGRAKNRRVEIKIYTSET